MSSLRAVLLLLVLLAALRPAHAVAEVFGRWTTHGVSAVVELTPCSDGVTLCGTIRWLWDALDERGRPRLDAQNADAEPAHPAAGRRHDPLRLEGRSGRRLAGWIYNPEDGQTYRATVKRRGADTLVVEGCVRIACSKQVWRKASSVAEALR